MPMTGSNRFARSVVTEIEGIALSASLSLFPP